MPFANCIVSIWTDQPLVYFSMIEWCYCDKLSEPSMISIVSPDWNSCEFCLFWWPNSLVNYVNDFQWCQLIYSAQFDHYENRWSSAHANNARIVSIAVDRVERIRRVAVELCFVLCLCFHQKPSENPLCSSSGQSRRRDRSTKIWQATEAMPHESHSSNFARWMCECGVHLVWSMLSSVYAIGRPHTNPSSDSNRRIDCVLQSHHTLSCNCHRLEPAYCNTSWHRNSFGNWQWPTVREIAWTNNGTNSLPYSVCAIATGRPRRKLNRLECLSEWPLCIRIAFSHSNRMQNRMRIYSEIATEFWWTTSSLTFSIASAGHWPEFGPVLIQNRYFILFDFSLRDQNRIRLFFIRTQHTRETSVKHLECHWIRLKLANSSINSIFLQLFRCKFIVGLFSI